MKIIKKRSIKVLMPFTRSIVGGSFVSSSLLAIGLQKDGNEVIALFPEEGPATELFKKSGIKVEVVEFSSIQPSTDSLGVFVNLVKYLVLFIRSTIYLSKNSYDIVHCNDDSSILPWGGACRINKIPCVWHVRRSRKSKVDFIRSFFSDKKICISGYVSSRFDKSDGVVIYNPVDVCHQGVDEKGAKKRMDIGISSDDFVLIQIGRDDPYKRPEWSLRSIEELSCKFSNIKLIMLGDYSDDRIKELLSLVSLPNRKKVYFPGWVEDVESFLCASDALIHPAKNEPFGRIFIESFACGKPVVTTSSGAAPEIVENGIHGYACCDDNFSDFLEKINLLIEDNYFDPLVLVNYAKGFSLEGHASLVTDLYDDVLSGEGRCRVY
ncbi:glycosyltransferase family 4 protein [Halomonas salinarum]|uniref:glycosyltransferase family 4 protein n=1 Tax=Halomonas salinarum TaxID=1158993 RepID=UPI001439EA75|nr:glycosyltransferase family 4 protein [Halomonas salinarum]